MAKHIDINIQSLCMMMVVFDANHLNSVRRSSSRTGGASQPEEKVHRPVAVIGAPRPGCPASDSVPIHAVNIGYRRVAVRGKHRSRIIIPGITAVVGSRQHIRGVGLQYESRGCMCHAHLQRRLSCRNIYADKSSSIRNGMQHVHGCRQYTFLCITIPQFHMLYILRARHRKPTQCRHRQNRSAALWCRKRAAHGARDLSDTPPTAHRHHPRLHCVWFPRCVPVFPRCVPVFPRWWLWGVALRSGDARRRRRLDQQDPIGSDVAVGAGGVDVKRCRPGRERGGNHGVRARARIKPRHPVRCRRCGPGIRRSQVDGCTVSGRSWSRRAWPTLSAGAGSGCDNLWKIGHDVVP
eukprot:m.296444 g.296444  ORF g.296444 m.296444 type:complete len:351 (-) comp20062_c0_seq2:1681-2733(-)